MLNWFIDNEILSILFGETSHPELLKRCHPLLRFMYANNSLKINELDNICNLAFEKHDAFRNSIIKIFADIADILQCEELEHIFSRMKSLKYTEIDNDILQLIKNMCFNNHVIAYHQNTYDTSNQFLIIDNNVMYYRIICKT